MNRITVAEIGQIRKTVLESPGRPRGNLPVYEVDALWAIAEILAEIRDVMRFEAGLELEPDHADPGE